MFAKMVLSFIAPPEVYDSSSHSTSLLTFAMASLSNFSSSNRHGVVPHCGFKIYFPNAHEVKHLDMLFAIHVLYSVKYVFKFGEELP